MNRQQRLLVNWTLNSLSQEPEKWDNREYQKEPGYLLRHDNGVEVWIANGTSGLEIRGDAVRVGGVTMASSLFGPLIPWRSNIYRAASKIAEGILIKQLAGQLLGEAS